MCYKRKEMNINGVKTKESPRAKNGESERGVIVYVMKILKFMLFYPQGSLNPKKNNDFL